MQVEFVWDELLFAFVRVNNIEEFFNAPHCPDNFINNTVKIEFVEKGGVLYDIHFEQVFGDVLGQLELLSAKAEVIYRVHGEDMTNIEPAVELAYGLAMRPERVAQ